MKNFDFEQFNFEPSESSQRAVKIYHRQRFARKIALNARHGLLKSDIDFLRATGNYPESVLNTLIVRDTKAAIRPKHKLHKEFTPKIFHQRLNLALVAAWLRRWLNITLI